MRTDKELLQIAIDNIRHLKTGLCSLFKELWQFGYYTEQEYYQILNLIRCNIPSKEDYFIYKGYYFEPGSKFVRIEYLKKLQSQCN